MVETSVAEALRESFWQLKRSRIRSSPVHSTRASSLGHPCERELFYERTAWQLRELPPPELQAIFDLGHHLEKYVVHELEEMGVEVAQRGKDYQERALELTGHIDAKIRPKTLPKAIPAEIKGLNPYTAGTIKTIHDIREHKQIWVRKYYAQLQAYLFLDGSELGVFVLLNKSTGLIDFVDCPLDYEFAEQLLKKAERIRDAVRANQPPPRMQSDECRRCPFAHVCQPDIDFGQGVTLLDAPELEAMLRRRDELEQAAREFEALDKTIKKSLPHKPEMVLGDWVITGQEVQRKGYEVKASSYWKAEIRRVMKDKEKSDAEQQQTESF